MMTDPYTDAWQLCDDDGMVRSGAQHHGTDYFCTGSAHIATPVGRYHIRCTNPVHDVKPLATGGVVPFGATFVVGGGGCVLMPHPGWRPAMPNETPGELTPEART